LWNTKGQLLHTLTGHSSTVYGVAFSSDGQTIASASWDKTVKLWNTKGQLLHTLTGHRSPVRGVAFSPNGQTIASASLDKTVKLWNIKGQLLHTLTGHRSYVNGVAFSSDGQTIASASADKTVKLWNTKGQLLHTLTGHRSYVNGVAFSSDGQTIASASLDNTVKLWNTKGQLLHTLTGHRSYVNGVAFSSDGQTIASASYDNTVKLWNIKGQLLHTLTGHRSPVLGVAFSSDGQTIASASYDNTVKLWNLNLDNLLALGCDWLQDYLISHPEALVELGQCQNQNKSLLLAAADTLVTQGEQLAHDGDFDGAVTKFKQANVWKPKLGLNPEVKAAPAYVAQGIEKSKNGDSDGAVAKFKQAQQLDPNVDLDPNTPAIDKNPQAVAKKLVTPALVNQGREKAQDGDFDGAVAKFKQAQQLDPNIDLDPDTPVIDKNPQAVAKKLVVKALIQQGEELAKQGNVKKGIEKFTQAQKLDSSLKIPAESWGSICVMGSSYNQAVDVMFACEKAVALASKKEQADAKAVRGLAKALTGDKLGAITDFDVYLQSQEIPNESKKQVQGWVNTLRAGQNPFTPEVLKKLRGE
jgi:tetratricopeptide (TPR) repeat protein